VAARALGWKQLAAGSAGSGGQADERMLSRIRALLAKAEAMSSTDVR